MGEYTVYYDSGTSNTRLYLLDSTLHVLCSKQKRVGSKDCAIAGSNLVLVEGLWELYQQTLAENQLTDSAVGKIYASGMITSRFGLKEVPHLPAPVSAAQLNAGIFPFREEQRFGREIFLIPGVRTVSEDISFVNMMRGEELEIMGAVTTLSAQCPGEKVALILPGSHTHVALVEGETILDIASNFTGELFFALQKGTILSPLLNEQTIGTDPDALRKGLENLNRFGITRALYVAQVMQTFGTGNALSRKSYVEGIVSGGVIQALDYYYSTAWQDCHTVAIAAGDAQFEVFSTLLAGKPYAKRLLRLSAGADQSLAVAGLRTLLA